MAALKRSINHRLQALETEFAISTLPTTRSKKQTLEILQDYGLVRPTLLSELMTIRNEIEHKDRTPPNVRDCRMYVDVVWYFLKSTDQLLDMVVQDVVYDDPRSNSLLNFEFQTSSKWRVAVEGTVIPGLLQESRADNDDLEILEFKNSTRSTMKDTKFSGVVNMTPQTFLRLARDYFGVQGYAHEDGGA